MDFHSRIVRLSLNSLSLSMSIIVPKTKDSIDNHRCEKYSFETKVSDADKIIRRSNGFQFIVRGSRVTRAGAHARMNFRAANGAFAIGMRQSRRGCDTLHASASHSFESKRVGSFVPSRDRRPRFFNFRFR